VKLKKAIGRIACALPFRYSIYFVLPPHFWFSRAKGFCIDPWELHCRTCQGEGWERWLLASGQLELLTAGDAREAAGICSRETGVFPDFRAPKFPLAVSGIQQRS